MIIAMEIKLKILIVLYSKSRVEVSVVKKKFDAIFLVSIEKIYVFSKLERVQVSFKENSPGCQYNFCFYLYILTCW